MATSSVLNIPHSVRSGIQDPPLYSFLLHLWMQLGRDEFYLRFLSVVFSLMSVVGATLLGYRLSGPLTGLIAGMIMAVLPSEIRYAQEVGQYALMVCLITWCLVALLGLLKESSRSKCLLWAGLAIAATYSYYGTVIPVVVPFSLVLVGGLIGRDWQSSKERSLAFLLYSVGIAPLVLYFLPRQLFRGPTAKALNIPLSSPVEELQSMWISTQQLIAFQFTGWPWTHVPPWVPFLLVMLLLLISARAERPGRYLLLWLLSTWVVYYLIGKLGLFPYEFRYGLILTPLLVPAISHGLSRTLEKRQQWALGALILFGVIAIAVISLPNRTLRAKLHESADWEWPETEDLRPVVKYWLENRNGVQPTYVYYGAVPVFRYYLTLFGQDSHDLPPTWYLDCWKGGSPAYCHANDILDIGEKAF